MIIDKEVPSKFLPIIQPIAIPRGVPDINEIKTARVMQERNSYLFLANVAPTEKPTGIL